jgi:hypothetical protein
MPPTRIPGTQIRDSSVQRVDLDITTTGQAVIARAIVDTTYLSMSSTGIDSGTGDVSFSLANSGITAGEWAVATYDVKGRATSGRALAATDLPTTGIGTGTSSKVTYDNYGRITAVGSLAAGDVPSGSTYYVQNQSATAQSADMRITGSVGGGNVRVYENTAVYYIELLAAAGLAVNRSFTLPSVYGTNGDVLSGNGAGVLSWLTLSSTYVPVAGATTVTGQKTFSNGLIVSANDLQVPKPANVLIMMHFDGKSGSRQIIDLAGNKWTNVTPSVASASPASLNTSTYKWGVSSLSLNGSSNFLELSGTIYSKFGIGTGDFTTEFQVNFNSVSVAQVFQTIGSSANGLVIRYVNASGIHVDIAGSNWTFAWTPSTGTWYHVAVVRSSSSLSVYVNGSQIGTTQTASGSISTPTYPPTLFAFGRAGNTTVPVNHVSAFVDEFVMYNTAKWTTAFSAPTAANAYNTLVMAPPTNNSLDAGQILVSDGGGNAVAAPPRVVTTVNFALSEFVSNTTKYFYVCCGAGATQEDAKRSGNSSGMANSNSCSPFLVPINGKITKAILNVVGTGVNQGTAAAVCYYQVQLYRVGYSAEHDPNINSGNPIQIDFMFSSSSNPVGRYTVGASNLKIERTDLDTVVYAGDMLALKFLNGSTTSLIGLTQMAFVTLVIEETF